MLQHFLGGNNSPAVAHSAAGLLHYEGCYFVRGLVVIDEGEVL